MLSEFGSQPRNTGGTVARSPQSDDRLRFTPSHAPCGAARASLSNGRWCKADKLAAPAYCRPRAHARGTIHRVRAIGPQGLRSGLWQQHKKKNMKKLRPSNDETVRSARRPCMQRRTKKIQPEAGPIEREKTPDESSASSVVSRGGESQRCTRAPRPAAAEQRAITPCARRQLQQPVRDERVSANPSNATLVENTTMAAKMVNMSGHPSSNGRCSPISPTPRPIAHNTRPKAVDSNRSKRDCVRPAASTRKKALNSLAGKRPFLRPSRSFRSPISHGSLRKHKFNSPRPTTQQNRPWFDIRTRHQRERSTGHPARFARPCAWPARGRARSAPWPRRQPSCTRNESR